MNASELSIILSQKLRISKVEVTKRIDDTIAVITTELQKNNLVTLANLGTLEVSKRNERISSNPATGKKTLLPPKLVVKFKSSTQLKDKLKTLKP